MKSRPRHDPRTKLLDAALKLIRETAARVDDICAAAGFTTGAFILAKARQGPEIAADSIDHLRRYIELLFNRDSTGSNRDDHRNP